MSILQTSDDDNFEWESYLDELLELESGLTYWEIDFIESLDDHARGRPLSDKQFEVLEQIHQKLIR